LRFVNAIHETIGFRFTKPYEHVLVAYDERDLVDLWKR